MPARIRPGLRIGAMPPWAALLVTIAAGFAAATTAAGAERSGAGPCRNGVLALVHFLDAGEQGTADYAQAFRGVTETCGPGAGKRKSKGASVFAGQDACRRLALRLLDALEESRVSSRAFGRARDAFARDCAPPDTGRP